jgi:tetrahydromethanopterin S-methyltransferase subunit F
VRRNGKIFKIKHRYSYTKKRSCESKTGGTTIKMNENYEKSPSFQYTYSAKQQAETERTVNRILEKYLPREESKLERLKRLDAGAPTAGTIAGLALGTVSALVTGLGMCCSIVWGAQYFVLGIALGILGLIGAGFSYPLYRYITRKRREKLAPEILMLAEELLRQ